MSAATRRIFAGKYEVERVLGEGGMGVVFLARHSRLGTRVAIKILGHALREVPELVARFEREALAAGALSSAHVVRVYDVDATEDGTPYIVMEPLEGCDLGHLLDREGPQPLARAARWVLEACDAIAEAHGHGIIHRDLKPSNLFLATQPDGRVIVKVLDFGVAKMAHGGHPSQLTQAVSPLGTPQYMSPEQVRCARDVDQRTDIWSLGVTLHELVTGSPPFAHEEPSACIASIAADPLPDPRSFGVDLPEGFVRVLARALAKDVNQRFSSIAAFARALAPFADASDADVRAAVERAAARASQPEPEPAFEPEPASEPAPAPASELRQAWSPKPPSKHRPFAFAAAVFLGLVAVLAIPKCVESGAAAPQPTALVQPTASATPPPSSAEPAPAPAPVRVAPAPAPRAVRRVVVRPPRHVASAPTVHGGLTGPGF